MTEMGKFKDSVFDSIRADYIANGKDSVLYRFLLEGKMKEKCKGVTPKKRDQMIHKVATDLMYNLGYPLAAEKKVSEAKIDIAEFEENYSTKSKKEDYWYKEDKETPEEKKNKAKNMIQDKLHAAEQNKKIATGRKSMHNNTALELIDKWYAVHGDTSFSGGDVINEECEKLYNILRKDKKAEYAIVPIRINKQVGGGVYIIGNEIEVSNDFLGGQRGYCRIVVWVPTIPSDGTTRFIMELSDEYDYVDTALDFYENAVAHNSLQEIINMNETAPNGIPEAFMIYFDNADREDDIWGIVNVDDMDEARRELDGDK